MRVRVKCPDCEYLQIVMVVKENLKPENPHTCVRCSSVFKFRNPIQKPVGELFEDLFNMFSGGKK